MNNEIKINVPEGMEIDKENSTFECIKFKPKWIPKRGDIAATGKDLNQTILVSDYIKESYVGFEVKSLAVLNTQTTLLTMWNPNGPSLWVLREASTSEKELFINKLKENGYIYDPNDPRVIYKKEKELPKTWEEFRKNNPIKPDEHYVCTNSTIIRGNFLRESKERIEDTDDNLLPSKEYAEAMLALCKLIQLRDYYNDGWKPDWSDGEVKYVIMLDQNKVVCGKRSSTNAVLVFKKQTLRNAFLDNFKDLIEQAKLLL